MRFRKLRHECFREDTVVYVHQKQRILRTPFLILLSIGKKCNFFFIFFISRGIDVRRQTNFN